MRLTTRRPAPGLRLLAVNHAIAEIARMEAHEARRRHDRAALAAEMDALGLRLLRPVRRVPSSHPEPPKAA